MALGLEAEARVRKAGQDPDRKRAARRIIAIERYARKELRDLEALYRVSKPRIGLSRALQREWGDYREAFENLVANIRDIRDSIESVVTKEVSKAGVDLSVRERMEAALNEISHLARHETKAGRNVVEKVAEEIRTNTRTITIQSVRNVESTIRTVMAEFARHDLTGLDDQRLIAERSKLEAPIREALEKSNPHPGLSSLAVGSRRRDGGLLRCR